jgi:hypothetical protein
LDYPWYDIVKSGEIIEQGDIIRRCPNVIPLEDPLEIPTDDLETYVDVYDVIVLTQSCDIKWKKTELVLVCPVWPLKTLIKKSKQFESKINQLYNGDILAYHLLDQCLIKIKEKEEEEEDEVVSYELPIEDHAIVGYRRFNPQLEYDYDVKSYNDHLVVDFKYAFSVPLDFILELVKSRGNRLRLLPPFREKLSQSYGRFIMRIGLPKDITKIK